MPRSNISVLLLNIIGFIIFAVGTAYALMTHELHQRLPFFANLSHPAHVGIGAGLVLISIVVFVSAEKVRKRSSGLV